MNKLIRNSIAEFLNFTSQACEESLDENSVCRDFRHTGSDGKFYKTYFYNLCVVISVGYRVNSKRATRFRQWVTQVLYDFSVSNCSNSFLRKYTDVLNIKGLVPKQKKVVNIDAMNEYIYCRFDSCKK